MRDSLYRWIEKNIPRALAWLAVTAYQLTGDWRGWRPLLTRTSAHLAVITVTIAALALSQIDWPAQAASTLSAPALSASIKSSEEKSDDTESSTANTLVKLGGHAVSQSDRHQNTSPIVRLAQPHTIIPDRPRLGVITYTVQTGDTVESIAAQFGLDPTTIMWSNSEIEDAPDLLRIGQDVTILPIDGVYHTIGVSDTLTSIAEEYKVESEVITRCEYNHLEGPEYAIAVGDNLIVPGGEKPYEPKVVTTYAGTVPEGARGTGGFQWPVLGIITQGYWYGHRAIDVGAPTGSALLASDGGFVSFAGWTDVGYGYLVVIDHANGYATYYAHLSNIYVFDGQAVERGQVIGAVGSTGWSTGPHLHFEIRYNGTQQNPLAYLR